MRTRRQPIPPTCCDPTDVGVQQCGKFCVLGSTPWLHSVRLTVDLMAHLRQVDNNRRALHASPLNITAGRWSRRGSQHLISIIAKMQKSKEQPKHLICFYWFRNCIWGRSSCRSLRMFVRLWNMRFTMSRFGFQAWSSRPSDL